MASAHEQVELASSEHGRLGARAWPLFSGAIVVGAVALLLALLLSLFLEDGWRRFGFAYVIGYAFFLSLSLGAMAFVLLTHLFRAGWSVVVRRPAEVLAGNTPVLAILFAPVLVYVLLNNGWVYPWAQDLDAAAQATAEAETHAAQVAAELDWVEPGDAPGTGANPYGQMQQTVRDAEAAGLERTQLAGMPLPWLDYVIGKQPYLTNGFFIARWVVYLGFFVLVGVWYWRQSVRQDETLEAGHTRRMEMLSAPVTLVFALMLTFAAFDLMMSMDPLWYSTIFGVYYFAGAMVGFLSLLILSIMGLQKWGYMQSVRDDHFHDLGKLLFAFVFFWGYIAFSQYMLLWYAQIPDTAYWYDTRGLTTVPGRQSGWTWVGLALLFGHLLIPFAGLLSRHVKRCRKALAFWAVWLLVFHWVDLWWVVMPMFEVGRLPAPVLELLVLVGIGGLFFAGAVRLAGRGRLVPVGDPRLRESLAFHNV